MRGAAVRLVRGGHDVALLMIARPGVPARVEQPGANVPKLGLVRAVPDVAKLPPDAAPGTYSVCSLIIFRHAGPKKDIYVCGSLVVR